MRETRKTAKSIIFTPHSSGREISELKWSEGLKTYLDAKKTQGKVTRHLDNVEHAVKVFIEIAGDLPIEKTTDEILISFMESVVTRPVKHPRSGKVLRLSGPKVANHHRKELITVARYLLRYARKITDIPFKDVTPLPAEPEVRTPIPKKQVSDYLDSLPSHILRPVLMVLLYGLRSTAVCNITLADNDKDTLHAIDKNDTHANIPIDELLKVIIRDSLAYREEKQTASDRLFVTAHGRAWERTTLLKAAWRWRLKSATVGVAVEKCYTPIYFWFCLKGDFDHGVSNSFFSGTGGRRCTQTWSNGKKFVVGC